MSMNELFTTETLTVAVIAIATLGSIKLANYVRPGGRYMLPENARKDTIKIIDSLDQGGTMCVRAGELNSSLWSHEDYLGALYYAAKKRDISIKILFGPHFDVNNIEFVKQMSGLDNVKYRRAEKREMPHFTIFDSQYYLLEGSHGPLEKNKVKTIIIRKSNEKATVLTETFNSLWEEAEDFNLFKEIGDYDADSDINPNNNDGKFVLIQRNEELGGIISADKIQIDKLKAALPREYRKQRDAA